MPLIDLGGCIMGIRGPRGSEADLDVQQAVAQLELPLWLVELDAFTIVALSGTALRSLNQAPSEVIGAPILELLRADERGRAKAALEAIRDGVIDFYGARAHVMDASVGLVEEWVRSVRLGGRHMAFVETIPANVSRVRPLAEYLGTEPRSLAIGVTDDAFVIESVSEDVVDLVGIAPHELVGHSLVQGGQRYEVSRLFEASRLTRTGGSVAIAARFTDASGAQKDLSCILICLGGEEHRYGFILVPIRALADGAAAKRAALLEQHLWKIAAEVEASGILQNLVDLPNPAILKEIGTLTTRQWDVLSRLMRGERVPMIARELFVSQSTVRNHLNAIFQEFGVHSQGELLDLLKTKDSSSK
jgi:DNA-binding CsgD family transcriptional regulator/PAS domain-containing protein